MNSAEDILATANSTPTPQSRLTATARNKLGDELVTGPTHNNLHDLRILLGSSLPWMPCLLADCSDIVTAPIKCLIMRKIVGL